MHLVDKHNIAVVVYHIPENTECVNYVHCHKNCLFICEQFVGKELTWITYEIGPCTILVILIIDLSTFPCQALQWYIK